MNCTQNQCCSPTINNKRCVNQVFKSSRHCKTHYPYANKLYMKYKKICDVAYNLNINTVDHNKKYNTNNNTNTNANISRKKVVDVEDFKKIIMEKHDYFTHCYVWLNKAFTARLQHRKYAFVPECYDDGHNYQFEMLQDKINLCETKLMEVNSEYEKHKYLFDIQPDILNMANVLNTQNISNSMQLVPYVKISSMSNTLNTSKTTNRFERLSVANKNNHNHKKHTDKHDKHTDKHTNKHTDKHNHDNNDQDDDQDDDNENENDKFDIQEIKQKIKKCNRMREQMEREEEQIIQKYIEENQQILDWRYKVTELIATFIEKLCSPIIVFKEDECRLSIYAAIHNLVRELYNICYFEKDYVPSKCKDCTCGNYITFPLTLGCSCIFNNNTIFKYFNLLSVDSLKKFYEVLLFNANKIKPFIEDLYFYNIMFDENMIFMQMELAWSPEKNRLILLQANEEKIPKISSMFASYRKKQSLRPIIKLNKDK